MKQLSFILLLLSSVAFADPDSNCVGDPHHCGGDGGGTIDIGIDLSSDNSALATANGGDGGTASIGGYESRAIALANSLGDVDINDCRESTQWGTPLFSRQGVRLNPWCAAEVYDAKGMHKMAAVMRCEIKEIKRHFTTKDECLEANIIIPQVVQVVAYEPPPLPTSRSQADLDREEEEEEQHNDLAERLAILEAKREADAKRVSAAIRNQQEREQEQRAYAQQAIVDLEQYKK